MLLEEIRNNILGCADCPLYKYGNGKVVGSYPKDGRANVAFVVDCPTTQEGQVGLPFVDRVGELVNPAIDASSLDRNDLAVLHTVKCCTPKNRMPVEYEFLLCREWLKLQLAILRPELILAMGEVALSALMDTKNGVLEKTEEESLIFEKCRKLPILAQFPNGDLVMIYATYSPNIVIANYPTVERTRVEEEIQKDIQYFGTKYDNLKAIYGNNKKDIQEG